MKHSWIEFGHLKTQTVLLEVTVACTPHMFVKRCFEKSHRPKLILTCYNMIRQKHEDCNGITEVCCIILAQVHEQVR